MSKVVKLENCLKIASGLNLQSDIRFSYFCTLFIVFWSLLFSLQRIFPQQNSRNLFFSHSATLRTSMTLTLVFNHHNIFLEKASLLIYA